MKLQLKSYQANFYLINIIYVFSFPCLVLTIVKIGMGLNLQVEHKEFAYIMNRKTCSTRFNP